jgi:DNA polymerase III sliding clamp (beta) subunit (PCNA family)
VAELKAALPGFSKIIGRTRSLPVLGCIRLSLDPATQFIDLQATDLDQIATCRLENKAAGLPGQMLVCLDELSKIVKGCAGTESLRFCSAKKETNICFPMGGSMVTRPLMHIDPVEWPAAQVIDQESFALDESFKQALKEALESASTDSSRYVLNGVCLDVRDKDCHCVIGTDGRQLYCANSFAFNLPESLIVPTTKFVTWPAFVNDGHWKLRMLPGIKVDPKDKKADKSKEAPPWFQIESEHWSYVARAVDGEYPNWQQVVPNDTAGWTSIRLTQEASQMMQQAVQMLPGADLTNQTVVLQVTPDRFLLHARGKEDQQDTTMTVPEVPIIGKPVEVALNRTYLLRALRFGLNELRICDSLRPVVFSSPDKKMVVMPVRLDNPAAPAPQAQPAAQTPAPAAEALAQPAPAAEPANTSPKENASVAPPSAAVAENPTEKKTERNTMSQNTGTTPQQRGNGNGNSNGKQIGEVGSLDAVMEKIDSLKATLRQVITDLSDTQNLIKAAAKEQKASEKEVESVRQTLRSLQKVEI